MRVLRSLSLVTALSTATAADAQTVQLQFPSGPTAPAVTVAGFFLGPFSATLLSDPTLPTVSIFCVDLLNAVNWGQQWQANVSNLGQTNLSATRAGSGALDSYRKAAWLTSQLSPSTDPVARAEIHAAIWSLFTPGISVAGFTGQSRVTAANSFAASSAWSSYNWSQYSVLTGVATTGTSFGGPQEFITNTALVQPAVTPEPATWLLLGTGLVAVLGLP